MMDLRSRLLSILSISSISSIRQQIRVAVARVLLVQDNVPEYRQDTAENSSATRSWLKLEGRLFTGKTHVDQETRRCFLF